VNGWWGNERSESKNRLLVRHNVDYRIHARRKQISNTGAAMLQLTGNDMETTTAMRIIIRQKCETFSDAELVEKLIEELEEALEAAREYQENPCERTLKAMAEELADVRVAGEMTLSDAFLGFASYHKAKVLKALYEQIPAAIRRAFIAAQKNN